MPGLFWQCCRAFSRCSHSFLRGYWPFQPEETFSCTTWCIDYHFSPFRPGKIFEKVDQFLVPFIVYRKAISNSLYVCFLLSMGGLLLLLQNIEGRYFWMKGMLRILTRRIMRGLREGNIVPPMKQRRVCTQRVYKIVVFHFLKTQTTSLLM